MRKRVSMLLVFLIGLTIFVTSVLVSATSKTGYELLRDSIESTYFGVKKFDSYTTTTQAKFVYDGIEVFKTSYISKLDIKNDIRESTNNDFDLTRGRDNKSYYYSDKLKSISTSDFEEYSWFDKPQDTGDTMGTNVHYIDNSEYEKEMFRTAKKIADAAITTFNMQNIITAVSDGEGGHKLTATLNESQVPVLVNAVVSAIFKMQYPSTVSTVYYYNDRVINESENSDILTDLGELEDLYIKSVTGNGHITKDDVLDKVYVVLVFSGTDANGNSHKIEVEVLYELTDINSTVIKEPDLTGKKVIKNEYIDPYRPKYDKADLEPVLGIYKKDVIEMVDNKYVKTGEMIFNVQSIDDQNVVTAEVSMVKNGETVKKETVKMVPEYVDRGRFIDFRRDGHGMYQPNDDFDIVTSTFNYQFDLRSGSLQVNDYSGKYANVIVFNRIFE